jgi:hypothetical protein
LRSLSTRLLRPSRAQPFDLKASYPKLFKLHTIVKGLAPLKEYFASPAYATYAVNNAMYTNYSGSGYTGPFGPTTRTDIKPTAPVKKEKGAAAQAKQTPEEKAAAAAARRHASNLLVTPRTRLATPRPPRTSTSVHQQQYSSGGS